MKEYVTNRTMPLDVDFITFWNALSDRLKKAIEKYVPCFRESRSSYKPPWFHLNVQKLILEKNKLWQKLRTGNASIASSHYKKELECFNAGITQSCNSAREIGGIRSKVRP